MQGSRRANEREWPTDRSREALIPGIAQRRKARGDEIDRRHGLRLRAFRSGRGFLDDHDVAILEQLTQPLDRFASELRELVEEESTRDARVFGNVT